MKRRTLVIVPTYDERRTLAGLLAALLSLPVELDVLVVDDASPDGTGRLADGLAADDERIHVLHRPGKAGLGPAYRAGFSWGLARGYDRFVAMDADRSHDPGAVPALLDASDAADLVIGSRYVPGGRIERWSLPRRALSAAGNRYARSLTGLPVRDATSGFRVVHRAVLEAIDVGALRSDGYAFQLEVALRTWRAGFRTVEVPIVFVERTAGASKLSRAVVVEAIWRTARWSSGRGRGPVEPHVRSVEVTGVDPGR